MGALTPVAEEGVPWIAFWTALVVVGLSGELVQALTSLRPLRGPVVPPGALPADGEVELVPISGARGEPNEQDPRFSSYRSLEGEEATGPRPALGDMAPPPLLGKIAILSVFLGRDGCPWSDVEIAEAQAAILRAGRWIEREAIRWEAPVNVAVADTYFETDEDEADDVEMTFVPEGDGVAPLEARAVTKALVDLTRAASRLGFRDAAGWLGGINPRVEADVHVWLLHPRRAGRSLAIPLDRTELRGVSLAVCYAREANFPEPLVGFPFTDPVTIVHELMHLFGASDKYGVPLSSFPAKSVSSRDIMRLNELSLSRLRVDPRTAWEVGWGRQDRRRVT